ncbi:MAG: hypothetical protein GY749_07770 [Desulfobacteraceae bacterium]|nr:hypothetical protein [Desulfobacteraceae bacterium]
MSVTKIKQLLVPTLCVGTQSGRSASCFRQPETFFLRTDPDAERPVCIPTQSVTAAKLRGRHFKVPSGTADNSPAIHDTVGKF